MEAEAIQGWLKHQTPPRPNPTQVGMSRYGYLIAAYKWKNGGKKELSKMLLENQTKSETMIAVSMRIFKFTD